ncbi:MAG: gamma-glutamyltransferase [Alphaproteobacteria bacterium]|nr:gamma-glutamyltransferase [Alphaproteobacteria bacterium]
MFRSSAGFIGIVALTLVVCASIAPSSAAGRDVARGKAIAVVTPDVRASQAAWAVLQAGGSAADAAVSAQLVLGLVRPDLTGFGGGGFALHLDSATGVLQAFDAREAAPANAGRYLLTDANGAPLETSRAAVGGRAVGVPGTPALLAALHEVGGALTWADVTGPAIWLAEKGFAVSPELARAIEAHRSALGTYSGSSEYFLTGFGEPRPAGDTLYNHHYAETLRTFAVHGPAEFYSGDTATGIVRAVRELAADNRGLLTLEDIEHYAVRSHAPLCTPYRGHAVCSPGAPSSGVTVLEAMAILAHLDLAAGRNSIDGWRPLAQASRMAFADRALYLTDPVFMPVPETSLIASEYGAVKAANRSSSLSAENGDWAPHAAEAGEEGAFISVVDARGNAVSMATGLGERFGAHLMADGFLLNAALTDFSFLPSEGERRIANHVAGMKRPRSMLAPVMVFDSTGRLVLSLGAAQGAQSVAVLVADLVALLDWGMSLEEALGLPGFAAIDTVFVEEGLGGIPRLLERDGFTVRSQTLATSIAGIDLRNKRVSAVAAGAEKGLAKAE